MNWMFARAHIPEWEKGMRLVFLHFGKDWSPFFRVANWMWIENVSKESRFLLHSLALGPIHYFVSLRTFFSIGGKVREIVNVIPWARPDWKSLNGTHRRSHFQRNKNCPSFLKAKCRFYSAHHRADRKSIQAKTIVRIRESRIWGVGSEIAKYVISCCISPL